ncbi:hypothetical protein DIPPA_12441 [Diplonema papillatum]|nr:hypothetical protein DIPPA_12441 [Diplonema papillatum]
MHTTALWAAASACLVAGARGQHVRVGGNLVSGNADLQLAGLPPVMGDGDVFALPRLEKGERLSLHCEEALRGSCVFYVVQHNCLPCSLSSNGGLPSVFAETGFEARMCSPTFSLKSSGNVHEQYPMVTYQRELAAGENLAFTLNGPLAHTAVIATNLVKSGCSAQDHPLLCRRAAHCSWDANAESCIDAWCDPETANPSIPGAHPICRRMCQSLFAGQGAG